MTLPELTQCWCKADLTKHYAYAKITIDVTKTIKVGSCICSIKTNECNIQNHTNNSEEAHCNISYTFYNMSIIIAIDANTM
jgi:hypothetical protein